MIPIVGKYGYSIRRFAVERGYYIRRFAVGWGVYPTHCGRTWVWTGRTLSAPGPVHHVTRRWRDTHCGKIWVFHPSALQAGRRAGWGSEDFSYSFNQSCFYEFVSYLWVIRYIWLSRAVVSPKNSESCILASIFNEYSRCVGGFSTEKFMYAR